MELLEFTQSLADKEGNKIDPTHIGMPPDFPKEMYAIIGFKVKGEMTQLTIRTKNAPIGQMYVYDLQDCTNRSTSLPKAWRVPSYFNNLLVNKEKK